MMRATAAAAARAAQGVLLLLIRLYQGLVSPVLPALFGPACGCRFHPTCSHYAAEAVRVHGPYRGALLAARRLVRCTPLSAGGVDPVPPRRHEAPGARGGVVPAPQCVRVR